MMLKTQELLAVFSPITLDEMSGIRLMNRLDTKYVLPTDTLDVFLNLVREDYRIQEVEGERNMAYRTVYLDTPSHSMFLAHQCGRAVREKVRVRTYVSSCLSFLEVKNKNNKGRTDKKRIRVTSVDTVEEDGGKEFLHQYAWYDWEQLTPQLANSFHRITLVNNARTERLTIDNGICFRNLQNGNEAALIQLVVVELKRDGRTYSPARDILHRLHVQPASFSKYCVGCVLTDASLKHNRFKSRIGRILSINNSTSAGSDFIGTRDSLFTRYPESCLLKIS